MKYFEEKFNFYFSLNIHVLFSVKSYFLPRSKKKKIKNTRPANQIQFLRFKVRNENNKKKIYRKKRLKEKFNEKNHTLHISIGADKFLLIINNKLLGI